ncbi:hypothetical protein MLD38_040938 [Melastoma candidum]|nr:hypothetical protein MLD38_040938 [Melastoma candidum]
MISVSLKIINPSFPGNQPSFPSRRKPNNVKHVCLCKQGDGDEPVPPKDGDVEKQELLARIAMLQAEKVRLTDYLDERSDFLTKFGEEADAEFDKVGEEALQGLEEAGDRIMEDMESKMRAFEEAMEMNRAEIERNDEILAEFEGQIEKDRNEGLFFQSFYSKKPADVEKAKEEAAKIKDAMKQSAGSKTRRNIYVFLIATLAASIAESFVTSTSDWRKVAVLGAILVGLVTQLAYEQGVLSEEERAAAAKEERDREEK